MHTGRLSPHPRYVLPARVPCCQLDHTGLGDYFSGMSALQQLIEELNRQPEQVAGEVLMYLHSLPGYTQPAAPEKKGEDYWESHWSKFYGAFEGEEWEEPAERVIAR